MKKRLLLSVVIAFLAAIFVASWGFSLALRAGLLRRSLLSQLSLSFGRPVEVSRFGFSILAGPRLEGYSVTVGEDPRFGYEYFLRADELSASLRWRALFRGRVEIATVSLAQPSLNLVRGPDGRWNIETWLPSQNDQSPSAPGATRAPAGRRLSAPSFIPRFLSRIEVDGGRINFKRGSEKLQFALVDVSGHVELASSGRWTLDLEARPMRASVALQQAGLLHLQGTVGGTSARLRPAALDLSWEQVSVADAARLLHGSDYGLRGAMAAELSARTGANPPGGAGEARDRRDGAWLIDGVFRFQSVHRWDLAGRPDNPALNVKITTLWTPGEPRVQVSSSTLETAHSKLDAAAEIGWARGFDPRVRLISSEISLADLLSWRRAFYPGVAEDLAIDGTLGVDAAMAGWPPRLEQFGLASTGAVLRSEKSARSIRVGAIQAALKRSSIVLAPVSVTLAGSEQRAGTAIAAAASASVGVGILRIEASLGPLRIGDWPRNWNYRLAVSGDTVRVQDLMAAGAAFGWHPAGEWDLQGFARPQLVWNGSLHAGSSALSGKFDLRELQFTAGALDQPLMISAATVEFRPGAQRLKLSGAQALGSNWTGQLEHESAPDQWTFDLSADRLDLNDLRGWMSQRERPGFFRRFLSFAAALSPAQREPATAPFQARGRIRAGELVFAPLRIGRLDSAAEYDGRRLELHQAGGDLYGGRVTGDFVADFSAVPAYDFRGQIDRANLAALIAETSLRNRFAGIASGELALSARGTSREALLASLAGEGFLHVRDSLIRGINFNFAASGASGPPESDNQRQFATSTVSFRVGDGRVSVDPLLLSARNEQWEIVGSVDFAARLQMNLRSLLRPNVDRNSDPAREGDTWIVSGTLDSPQVNAQVRAETGAAVPPARRR